MVTEEEKQILLKKLEIETKRTGFIERTRKIRVICGTILCLVATVLPIVTSKVQPDFGMELIVFITTLIISKKPGNTGISRDIRTEFTTDLLLSD